MSIISRYGRDRRGASAVEFALILPVVLLFLLGIIDVGRFVWKLNEIEKATQIGARWAVVTTMICSGLAQYNFATEPSTPITQGDPIDNTQFKGAKFAGGSASTCSCVAGDPCDFANTADTAAYNRLVRRMNEISSSIVPANVSVDYTWSGLGYAGNPNGSDVSPIVTVNVRGLRFRPIFLAGLLTFSLPDFSYSLTMEDGQGNYSN